VNIVARKHKSEPATPTGHLTTVPGKTVQIEESSLSADEKVFILAHAEKLVHIQEML